MFTVVQALGMNPDSSLDADCARSRTIIIISCIIHQCQLKSCPYYQAAHLFAIYIPLNIALVVCIFWYGITHADDMPQPEMTAYQLISNVYQ